MSRGPRIPKIKFLAVVADIKAHPTTKFATIAARHKLSATSALIINTARTWGNYLAHKKATVTVRDSALHASLGWSKAERAEAAGLKPVTREQRVEKQFDRALKGGRPAAEVHGEYWNKSRDEVLLDRVKRSEDEIVRLGRALAIVSAVLSVLVLIGLFN